ncbi:hypothetical protein RJ640_009752 [Escallonia rubra]|uniref:Protein kinase domain-containing protein n=1 Tax=Escallonia rubra TaxID=112253 RepID=A0AA88R0M4_9ASTE|nr:hypothetical protein RJ640_009752 [Escallonia rubra]
MKAPAAESPANRKRQTSGGLDGLPTANASELELGLGLSISGSDSELEEEGAGLATLVQGTFGYINPEYFNSGLLTKKSNVYSFGVVLIELLTGENVISLDRPKNDKSLATFFLSSLENGRLDYILEDRVQREGQAEQIKGVADLARKCWRLKGDKRPTMKEVKEELEGLTDYKQHNSWGGIGHNLPN